MTDVVDVNPHDAVPPPPSEELNPISCELCRSRKIKCSRTLPSCNDCYRLNYPCKYPERAKRGPPTGYIDSLEKRLAQTEAALYNALATLGVGADVGAQVERSPDEVYDRFDKHSASLVRTERMATWARLPLNHSAGHQEWWRETHDKIIAPETPPNHSRQKTALAREVFSETLSILGIPSYPLSAQGQQPSQTQPEAFQPPPSDHTQPPEPTVQPDLALSTAQGPTTEEDPMVDPALSHHDGNLRLASAANEAVNKMNGKRSLDDGVDYVQRPTSSRKYF